MIEDPVPISLAPTRLHNLEENMQKVLDEWKIPGLALLLLKVGEVVLARGFGKRNVAEELDVTSRTLFPIGSTGKAFTAAAIAMLVEEGKLAWDTPVRQYIPTFKLYDQFATERLTVRDLLTHRSGLPRHELMWYKSRFTRKEAVARLQYLEPNVDLRTAFQYQNLMYATAGYLVECVTGQTWEEFVAERIFKPLGMTDSTTAIEDSLKTGDYALPYEEEEGEITRVPFYDRLQIIGPAGGISSNLEDLQHWLRFQLNGGKHGETQLLAAEHLAQNHIPQTIIPAGDILNFAEFSNSSYGMGWVVGMFRGQRMLQHSGGIDGFSAEIVLLPDTNVAVAVLTNHGGSVAPFVAALYSCDHLLGAEETNWSERWQTEFAKAKEQGEQMSAALAKVERVPDAPHSHPLEAYTGEYEHPGYGTATITRVDDALHFTYNDVTAPLTHLHFDIFEMFIKLAQYKTTVAFTSGEKGGIESLAVKLEPTVKPIVFTRVEKLAEKGRAMNSQTEKAISTAQLAGFEDDVHAALQDGKVPGAAVIIIKDGEVLLSQGFGKRNVAENLDVTPRTLFPIGSSGKAFTAAAIAMLVEDGKLEWEKPVRHYLPAFKLHDQFATERLTVRDLLCHRCGLPRHEFLWYGSDLTRKELVERLAYLEPSADFRTLYQYNNLMFATAGYLIEHVTGQTWEEFVAARIFKPLGMTTSNTAVEASQKTDDYALPYEEKNDEIKEVPFYSKFQAMGPAGGISTNLEDMEHWLRFQLNEGKHGETQLLAAEHLTQNHTPHTVIPTGQAVPMGKYPEIANWCYGQGWFVGSYRGHRMVQHGGSIDGFMAEVVLLPDDNSAVAVFTNHGGTMVPYIIAFTACDRLLGGEKTDWNERLQKEFANLKAQGEKQLAEMQAAEPTIPDTRPSHALGAYCGRYEHPGYGIVTISQVEDQLRFTYNNIPSSLTHVHYDIFELNLERFEFKAKVSFATAEKGEIDSLAVKMDPAVKAQVFTRMPGTATV